MKYTKIDLELPPIGERVVTIDEEGDIAIGFFYIRADNRKFNTESCLYRGSDAFFSFPTAPIKWALLPKFKTLKDVQPPIGIEVLFSYIFNGSRSYGMGIYISGDDVTKIFFPSIVDSWIELEQFKEDK